MSHRVVLTNDINDLASVKLDNKFPFNKIKVRHGVSRAQNVFGFPLMLTKIMIKCNKNKPKTT